MYDAQTGQEVESRDPATTLRGEEWICRRRGCEAINELGAYCARCGLPRGVSYRREEFDQTATRWDSYAAQAHAPPQSRADPRLIVTAILAFVVGLGLFGLFTLTARALTVAFSRALPG